MSAARERLRSICVIGGGQVAILAALALKKAVPDAAVTIVRLPVHPAAWADQAATALPFTNKLHDRLGVAEDELVLRAGGSHRLLTRYFDWSATGTSGAMPHGAQVDHQLRTRFAQEWGGGSRGALSGGQPGSLAEALADAGRFRVPPGDAASPLDEVDYALRWNGAAYADLLVAKAQGAGVVPVSGPVTATEPDGAGGMAAIVTGAGQRIAADLFVDCSGPEAVVQSALPDALWQGWSDFLPVRRILLARPGKAMLALEDRFTLLDHGWLGELAGRDGLHVSLGLREGVSEGDALRALAADPLRMVALMPGQTRTPWLGNVVALGDAAATFEPLAHLNLDLAHRQLALLLEVLPGCTIEPLERAEFNRRAGLMAAQVRDTLALHYAAPRARAVFGERALPESLAHLIDQYTRRGRLPHREEAALLAPEAMALLDALGFAGGVTTASRAEDAGAGEAERRRFEAKAAAALSYAPPYGEFMARMLQAG